MDVLLAILSRRRLQVMLRWTSSFHLNYLATSILTSSSSSGRDSRKGGSIRVESILVVLCPLSLLSSDWLLGIEASIHKVDVILVART